MNKLNLREGPKVEQKTVKLETLAKMYDITLPMIRKWAANREFPGIIRRKGGKRLYVDVAKFDAWFRSGEVDEAREGA